MKSDTVAVHGGYETDPTTRAVAVPIYQTVAYEFESADHGAALFNLEVERGTATAASAIRRLPCWSGAWPSLRAALSHCALAPARRR
jgi:O-acetylhomoserine (thiol)-lyase